MPVIGARIDHCWQGRDGRMSEQHYRSVGSIVGLAVGFGVMKALTLSGIVWAALFGAGGCVAGAIAAEKFFAWKQRRD